MARVLKNFRNNKQRKYNIYKVSTNVHINADYAAVDRLSQYSQYPRQNNQQLTLTIHN